MNKVLEKNQKLITIAIIAGILFARCNIGLVLGTATVLTNIFFNGIAFVYCCYLIYKDREPVKEALFNPAIAWILVFSTMVMIYGHFHIRYGADYYSRQLTVLTVAPAIIILVLFFYNKEDVLDILSASGSVVITTTFITSLIYDKDWADWLSGQFSRVGATPAGTVIDTGNLDLILLIPILYQIIVLKKRKQYIWAACLGIAQILVTGAKSSVLPIVFILAIMILSAAEDKRTLRRNMIILVVGAVVAFAAIIFVPALYDVIGYRIIELFTGINDAKPDLHTSTGQRMAMIAAFKEHYGEYPIFGHGFYAFREMPYSAVEEYHKGAEIAYRNVQLHLNYLELLFSYGIFGFVLYYWFPVYIIIKSFKANKTAKTIVAAIMIAFVFMDLGIDMYYKYLFPYYSYFLAYFMVKGQNIEKQKHC